MFCIFLLKYYNFIKILINYVEIGRIASDVLSFLCGVIFK